MKHILVTKKIDDYDGTVPLGKFDLEGFKNFIVMEVKNLLINANKNEFMYHEDFYFWLYILEDNTVYNFSSPDYILECFIFDKKSGNFEEGKINLAINDMFLTLDELFEKMAIVIS